MEKKQLEILTDRYLSVRQISEEVNKSPTTVRYWLKKHGLKSKLKPFNQGGESIKPEEFQKPFLCNECGEDRADRFYKARNRCKVCHNKQQMEYVKQLKRKAVGHKGGECQQCGYNKNYAALDFHHLDPEKKDVNWATSRHWSWSRLKKELDGCVLVCKNCHAEIHYPDHKRSVG